MSEAINENAYIVFDDTVIDKRHATEIETSKRQYGGNEHGVIQGIGLVNGQQKDYQKIEVLSWNEQELKSGKIIKIKKFPGAKKVKLNRSDCLYRQNGLYRYKRFISRFYGRCTKSV